MCCCSDASVLVATNSTSASGASRHSRHRRVRAHVVGYLFMCSVGAVARMQQESIATRVSPRQHLGALRYASHQCLQHPTSRGRALKTAASAPSCSSTISLSSFGVPFTEEEIEFLRAAQRCATDKAPTIYERGRAQGLFINRSVSSIQVDHSSSPLSDLIASSATIEQAWPHEGCRRNQHLVGPSRCVGMFL